MICELPIDISVRILGEFLSLKGMIRLDSAICCTNREKYLELLKWVQISHKIDLSNAAQNWLGLRHIKASAVSFLVDSKDMTIVSKPLFQSLQHLNIHVGSKSNNAQLGEWLTQISDNCPLMQTLQFQSIGFVCECYHIPATFLNQCSRLKNFHAFHIHFPPSLWKELWTRHVSFLCITPRRGHARVITEETGPLPEADFAVYTTSRGATGQYCVWNNMAIPEVHKVVSMFLPDKRVAAVSYSHLCRGSHVSMFGATFSGLKLVQLCSCVDMDAQTVTAIMQLPLVTCIELHHNHTITGLAPHATSLGKRIDVLQLNNFSAFTNDAWQMMKKMLPAVRHMTMRCYNMSQILEDNYNGLQILKPTDVRILL